MSFFGGACWGIPLTTVQARNQEGPSSNEVTVFSLSLVSFFSV